LIEDTARRVVAEVDSQVNVLGRGSDIQRAIKMYGRIGAALESHKFKTGFVNDPSQPSTSRSMVSLFMEDMLGTTEGILEDVFMLPSQAIRRTFGFINAHRVLLVLLMLNIFINLFLSGRSTVGYWHLRHAERVMLKAGVQANKAMVRMVSLKEIDELVTRGLIGANATDNGLWYDCVIALLIDIATANLPRFTLSMISRIQTMTTLRSSWLQLPVERLLN
jgi:hypothetical protein